MYAWTGSSPVLSTTSRTHAVYATALSSSSAATALVAAPGRAGADVGAEAGAEAGAGVRRAFRRPGWELGTKPP